MLRRSRLLTLTLVGLVLLCAVYLLRWPLFRGTLTRLASETISRSLECDVRLQGISGTILTGIHFRQMDVTATGEWSRLRTLSLENGEIRYNPIRLISGDLSALHVRVSRGSLNYDCDRTGSEPDKREVESPVSIPTRIPRIEISAVELFVTGGGYSMQINGGALSLESGIRPGAQSGNLLARTVTFSHSESTYVLDSVVCPLEYSSHGLRLGPVHSEEDENLLSAELTWKQQLPMRARLNLQAKTCGGRLAVEGWVNEQRKGSFDADIRLEEIDLASIPFAWFLSEPLPHALQGRLTLTGEVQGSALDASTLEATAHAALVGGAFDQLSPLDLTVGAAYKQGELSLFEGFGRTGSSWIDITNCTIPIREQAFRLDALTAAFAFRFVRFKRGVDCFAFEEPYAKLIARSDLEGEGRLEKGRLFLDPARLALDEGEFAFRGLGVAWSDEGTLIDVDDVKGEYEGKRFGLVEPARLRITPSGLDSVALTVQAGGGMVDVKGSVSNELVVDAQTEIWDVDPNLIRDLLPKDVADRVSWDGVHLRLDASGPIEDLSGTLDLRFKRFAFDAYLAHDMQVTLRRTQPDRLDVEAVRFTLETGGDLRVAGAFDLDPSRPWAVPTRFDADAEITDLDLAALHDLDASLKELEGTVWMKLHLQGDPKAPTGSLTTHAELARVPPQVQSLIDGPFDLGGAWNVELKATQDADGLTLEPLKLSGGAGSLTASSRLPLRFTPLAPGGIIKLDGMGPFEASLVMPRLDLILQEGTVSPVTAEAKLSGPFRYPSGNFSVHAAPFSIGLPDPMDLKFSGTLQKGWLGVDTLSLFRAGEKIATGRGSMNLNGDDPSTLTFPGPNTKLKLAMDMACLDVADHGAPFSGAGTFALRGEGTLGDPRYTLSMNIDRGEFFRWRNGDANAPATGQEIPPAFRFNGFMEANADGLAAGDMKLETLEGCVTASVQFPLFLDFASLGTDRFLAMDKPMHGNLSLDGLDLAFLNSYLPQIRRLKGLLSGEIVIDGSPLDPRFDGNLSLSKGACRIQGQVPSLEEVEADIGLTQDAITISRFTGEMGASPVSMTGRIALKELMPSEFDLGLTGQNVLLFRGLGMRMRADLYLSLTGPVEKALVRGNVKVVDSRFVRTISLVPEKGPPPIDEPLIPFSLTEPPFRDFVFDVDVTTPQSDGLMIDNNVARGDVRLDLALKGTGREPYFLGTAVFDDLLIKLPNFKFVVDSGTLVFPESNPYDPVIRCLAGGRRQSIDVSLLVEGPVTNPDIYLTSNTPLDYDELVLLVASGVFPTGEHAAAQLGAYVGEEIYNRFFATESTEAEASPFERLELGFGTEVGNDGTENFVLEYNFSGPWHLHVEQDVYKDWNAGFVYRIRFR